MCRLYHTRTGHSPYIIQHHHFFDEIEQGAEFFFSEEDYLSPEELNGTITKKKRRYSRIKIKYVAEYSVKSESSPTPPRLAQPASSASPSLPTPSPPRRRPRRSAVSSSISYAVPDSDDDLIADDNDGITREVKVIAKKRKCESNLQKWIKHLDLLLKDEQRKARYLWFIYHAHFSPVVL